MEFETSSAFDRRKIAHECEKAAICREVQSQFRLRGEACHHLIFGRRNALLGTVGHFKGVDEGTGCADLIEKDFRGNSKASIYRSVVPHERVSTIDDRLYTAVRAVGW